MRTTTVLVLIASLAALTACAQKPQNFETPEAAVQALIEAAQSDGNSAVLKVLGKSAEPIVDSGDPVADKNGREEFVAAYHGCEFARQDCRGFGRARSGRRQMALPHSRSSRNGGWHFDSAAGAEEIVNRRVGENELDTIQSCLAYVDAQREYYMRNAREGPVAALRQDGSSAPKARRTACTGPRARTRNRVRSAKASRRRARKVIAKEGTMKGEPFHGYIYRLLTEQGPNAPGGAYDYLVNDQLLGGFAAIAFPAEYGNSGVMTFIVSHDGVVYSQDLGTRHGEARAGDRQVRSGAAVEA